MAALGGSFIRVRVHFDYPPPAVVDCRKCWLLVDLNTCRVVADLESTIRDKFGFGRRSILNLFIEDCYLPHTESVYVVRDNDSVRVKVDSLPQVNGGSIHPEPSRETCRKRQRPPEGDEPGAHGASEELKKKKRKKGSEENVENEAKQKSSDESKKKKSGGAENDDKKKKKKKKKVEETEPKAKKTPAKVVQLIQNKPKTPQTRTHRNVSSSDSSSSSSEEDAAAKKAKKPAPKPPTSSGPAASKAPQKKRQPPPSSSSSSASSSSSEDEAASTSRTLQNKPQTAAESRSGSKPKPPPTAPPPPPPVRPVDATRPASESEEEITLVIKQPKHPPGFGFSQTSGAQAPWRGRGRGMSGRGGAGPRGRGDSRGGFRANGGGGGFETSFNGATEPSYETDSLTNTSVVLQNAPRPDYSSLPLLAAPPQVGQKIAFKLLELTENYTPEVSEYKEATILSFDHSSRQVELELRSSFQAPAEPGKFDLVYQNPDGSERVEYAVSRSSRVNELWDSLLEPRLII